MLDLLDEKRIIIIYKNLLYYLYSFGIDGRRSGVGKSSRFIDYYYFCSCIVSNTDDDGTSPTQPHDTLPPPIDSLFS